MTAKVGIVMPVSQTATQRCQLISSVLLFKCWVLMIENHFGSKHFPGV